MESRKKRERERMTVYGLVPLCLLSTVYCLLPSVYAKDEPIVHVAAESIARADQLTLGDIAEIRAADSMVVERLRAVALGYAPYVGVVRELPRDRIALAITAAG